MPSNKSRGLNVAFVEEGSITMKFGLHFFPDVSPEERPADLLFEDYLKIVDLVDQFGFEFVRIVEHYFEAYGGYSPNPLIYLAAASQRTKKARMIPGALLPVFSHPLKMAGEIGMLDAISKGRMDVAFARAFLPHEFTRFGISIDESRARFDEGVEVVRRLLEAEDVSYKGDFVQFENVTSLPRPTQKPRPPIWLAVLSTPQSFSEAGRKGYGIMANPLSGARMTNLLKLYRDAWREAGHPGEGRVMISFRMFCDEDGDRARKLFQGPVMAHLRALVAAATVTEGWGTGKSNKDYPGYEKILDHLKSETYEHQIESGSVWAGTPQEIRDQIERYYDQVGGFDYVSLNGLPYTMPRELVEGSLRLFAEQVIPFFTKSVKAA